MDPAAIPWGDLAPFILVGFTAQIIDGTFGMAFGMITNALLVMLGVPPIVASAATHSVECFTSGVSGLSHAAQRNVDWRLFARLAVPGIIGGLAGVWVLGWVDLSALQPLLLVYMAAVGVYLIWRAPRRPQGFRRLRMAGPIGAAGGFFDAYGGGWGPIVTGSLLAQGANPRTAIGTANAAEFFVTVTVLVAFIGTIGVASFAIAASGVLIGGVLAAPIGAYLTRRMAGRRLMSIAGLILVAISLYGMMSLTLNRTLPYAGF